MNKRTTIFYMVCFALALAVPRVSAAPIGGSNLEREYFMYAEDLGKWSAGIHSETRDRDVTASGIEHRLKSNRLQGYLAFDVADWITIYAAAGNFQNKIDHQKNSTDPIYSFGARFNLIHHEVAAPTLLENSFSVNGSLQYSRSEMKYGAENRKFEEIYASLTLSIINDIEGNKLFWPDAIAFYVGPVFSSISSGAFHEEQIGGFTTGLEFYCTQNTSINLGIVDFDEFGYTGGVHVNF